MSNAEPTQSTLIAPDPNATAVDAPTDLPSRQRLILVDGYGLAFRAFHALPLTMQTASGEIVNATFGFTAMLLDSIRAHRPDCVVMTFDIGKSFRHDEFADYKAHRPPMAPEMRGQMDRIREVIAALNIPVFEMEGYEADDIIGTLARQAVDLNMLALIVTGDSDLLQLVEEHVHVILPGAQRFSEYRMYDHDAVVERYGFEPTLIPDYKALVGDKSDNIPGVPGIGAKTATALLTKFGDVEEIIKHVDDVTPTRARNMLAENVELARQCKRLATIVTDAPVTLDVEACMLHDYDQVGVTRLFHDLEFRTLLSRLPESNRVAEVGDVVEEVGSGPLSTPVMVYTDEDLSALAERIRDAPTIAIDVETDSLSPLDAALVGFSIATADNASFYVPVKHISEPVATMDDIRTVLWPSIAEHPNVIAHHGKFDLAVFRQHELPLPKLAWDTMLAAYLLNEVVGLKDLAFRHLNWMMTPITDLIGTGRNQITMDEVPLDQTVAYAGADVEATLRLYPILGARVREREQDDLLDDIELALVPVLMDMERAGIAVDPAVIADLDVDVSANLEKLTGEIYQQVGHEFNIGSTKQLASVLFEELGLPSGRRNATGFSVSQEVLDGLRGAHTVVDLILEHRLLKKLKSTYIDALPNQINPKTGRIHTTFNQTIAATGRLSSVDPNLQNIPVRTEIGRMIRRAFVADNRPASQRIDEECVLFSADYSQMELRLMAHYSQDEALVAAFRQELDIHAATAAEVFGIDLKDVTADQRATAKVVNFGIMYGMQAYGLARDTGMSRSDAAAFIERYMARFSGVRGYIDQTLRDTARLGYAESLYGRRRYLPDIVSSGPKRMAAERAAINMPIQGTAADIMKVAMIQVAERMRDANLKSEMLLQVHDELLFEAPVSEVQRLRALVVETLEQVTSITVPLRVDTAVGPNWQQLRDMVDEDDSQSTERPE